MKKRLVLSLAVCCLFIALEANAEAYYNKISTNQVKFELNPALTNPTTAQKAAVKTSATQKQMTDKDLQIEGRIEKTQSESLYHGQSAEELQTMVTRIGKQIIIANGMNKNIYFKYSEKDETNAHVDVTNTVTVYKGLIKACNSEDELAYVIGHEIGHANSYHIVKGMGVSVASSVVNSVAAASIARATGNVWANAGVSMGTQMATKLGEQKISRIQENNADLLSMDYIAKAGYNPLAGIAIMNKIGSTYLDVLSDHPSTEKRIINMYKHVKANYPEYLSEGYDSSSYRTAVQAYIVSTQDME